MPKTDNCNIDPELKNDFLLILVSLTAARRRELAPELARLAEHFGVRMPQKSGKAPGTLKADSARRTYLLTCQAPNTCGNLQLTAEQTARAFGTTKQSLAVRCGRAGGALTLLAGDGCPWSLTPAYAANAAELREIERLSEVSIGSSLVPVDYESEKNPTGFKLLRITDPDDGETLLLTQAQTMRHIRYPTLPALLSSRGNSGVMIFALDREDPDEPRVHARHIKRVDVTEDEYTAVAQGASPAGIPRLKWSVKVPRT